MFAIIGGNSFLGSYAIKNILETTNEDIIATYDSVIPLPENKRIKWVKLDITNIDDLENIKNTFAETNQKLKCIYLVGYIKPDDVEKNPDIGFKVNIKGLVDFISLNKEYLECLYFASTDMVLGESIDDYKFKESDSPKPVNRYGAQKYICEQIVIGAGFNVFRCPLMIGKSLIPNRPHFIEHIESVVENKETFDVLSDYYESSLDYDNVSSLLLEVIATNDHSQKIMHICGDEKISKYEIAQRYCAKKGLEAEYLKPLPLKECTFFVAKRCNILMDNSQIKNKLNKKTIIIGEKG